MTTNHIAVPALVFNGVEIHDRNEMLCLTDMWKACGSPSDRRPDDWKKDSGHREFLDHVAMVLNAPVEGIWKGVRGRHGGGTNAHWQIGLAYAKWLDHDLHMWCNTVVRERMEGKPTGAFPPEVLEEIRRTDGISRMLAHKVTEQGKALAVMAEQVTALVAIVQPSVPGVVIRHGRTAGAVLKANGFTKCPRGTVVIVSNWLAANGCQVEGRVDTGMCRAKLFDPDKAEAWFKNGGAAAVARVVAEKNGQGALALSGPRHAPAIPPDMDSDGIGAVMIKGSPVYFDIRVKKLEPDTRYVVINVKGDVLVDIPHCSMVGRGGTLGPRGVLTSPQMEAVPGRHDPMPVQWEGVILGKVLERNNVVRLPA